MEENFSFVEVFLELTDTFGFSDHLLNRKLVVLDLFSELREVVSLVSNLCFNLHVLLL